MYTEKQADIPLNERRGARVDIGPPREEPVAWDNLIDFRSGGWSDTDTELNDPESLCSSVTYDSD